MTNNRECCGWTDWAAMAGMDEHGRRIRVGAPAPRPRVVVVGGGFAGLAAVRALDGAPVDITVIDRNNYHLATAALSPSEIAVPIRAVVGRQRNARVLLAEVSAIDLAARQVRLANAVVPYDYLVLAPGSRHSYFGHTDAHPEVFVIGDAAAARDAAERRLPGTAPVAVQQGCYVGASIRRLVRGESVDALSYHDRGMMAATGRGHAVASIMGLRLSGRAGWWAWLLVHIVRLIGFRSCFVVFVDCAWAYERSAA